MVLFPLTVFFFACSFFYLKLLSYTFIIIPLLSVVRSFVRCYCGWQAARCPNPADWEDVGGCGTLPEQQTTRKIIEFLPVNEPTLQPCWLMTRLTLRDAGRVQTAPSQLPDHHRVASSQRKGLWAWSITGTFARLYLTIAASSSRSVYVMRCPQRGSFPSLVTIPPSIAQRSNWTPTRDNDRDKGWQNAAQKWSYV